MSAGVVFFFFNFALYSEAEAVVHYSSMAKVGGSNAIKVP